MEINEQEQPRSEVVSLNQKFILFDPNRTSIQESAEAYSKVSKFISAFSLRTEILPNLPLTVNTWPIFASKTIAITPFSPGLGYIITEEDYDLETRIKKIKGLKGNQLFDASRIDFEKAPLYISVVSESKDLKKIGLASPTISPYIDDLKPELLSVLPRLRLQLFFPDSEYEAQSEEDEFRFENFYPSELGPLPSSDIKKRDPLIRIIEDREGLMLCVPSDQKQLQSIQAQFVLL